VKSVEYLKVGDTRTVVQILEPGTYQLGNRSSDRFVVTHVRCSIERVDEFTNVPLVGAQWRLKHFNHDTLKALPSWWQKAKAFLLRRDPPLPRAISIVDRSAK
jgi:hypothetical protein